jgi:hypothetical protein
MRDDFTHPRKLTGDEWAMNTTISRYSKSLIQSQPPPRYMNSALFGPKDDGLSWRRKRDEGGTLKLVARGKSAFSARSPNDDHRVALTADFS